VATQIATGLTVRTQEGDEIGQIKEIESGSFKVDASMERDYWLSAELVETVEDNSARLTLSRDHLNELKADSPEDASRLDAIQLLIEMHDEAKAKFRQILDAPSGQDAGMMWDHLYPVLNVHEEMEDTYLYGPLASEQPQDAVLGHYIERQDEEIAPIKSLMQDVSQMTPTAEGWRTQIAAIRDGLARHIEEEEGRIFPRIREVWDEQRLRQAGEQMKMMKQTRLGA
jgi:hypothetical protein